MGKLKKLGIGFGAVVAAILVVGAVAAIDVTYTENRLRDIELTEAEIRERALENVTVQELLDENERYKGEIVHYTGRIWQIQDQPGNVYGLNIQVDGQSMGDRTRILLKYLSETEPNIGSNIEFYGRVTGTWETTSILGSTLRFVTVDALLVSITES